MKMLQKPPLAIGTTFVYACVLATATHVPLPPDMLPGDSDKVVHFIAYLLLALLAGWIVWSFGKLTFGRLVLAGLAVAVFGAIDEMTQPLVNRHMSLYDWLADFAGVIVGISCWNVWRILAARQRRSSLEQSATGLAS